MPLSRQRRLPAAMLALVLAAGLGGTGLTSAVAAPAPSSASSAAAAPQASGSASGFLLYMFPVAQPACTGVGLNYSTDPYFTRKQCGFSEFTVSGATGAVKADLFAEGATTKFATLAATEDSQEPGTYQVDIAPDSTWPAGPIRMVVSDTVGVMGESIFYLNTLVATVSSGSATGPAAGFPVTGTVSEHVGGTPPSTTGVPALFKVRLTRPDGSTLFTSPVQTATNNGTFTYAVPPGTASGVTADASTGYKTSIGVSVVDATYNDPGTVPGTATGDWAAATAGTTSHAIQVPPTELILDNSFVSSVGWVKPSQGTGPDATTYDSIVTVSNLTGAPVNNATVTIPSPDGATFTGTGAATAGTAAITAGTVTWTIGTVPSGTVTNPQVLSLSLESTVDTLTADPELVWKDLSSTATIASTSTNGTSTTHGPKVIPPSSVYDTARYGDRPFPVVPLEFNDRDYQDTHTGDSLESVINDPDNPGSTFNLYQEMSIGQLFPDGTVPSAGIASADFTGFDPAMPFTSLTDGTPNTCHGTTYADVPLAPGTNPLYTERITNGVYNLPGNTDYYGDDSNGSAVIGSAAGVGALQNIDSGCGPTAKVVADAVALADPEIDYSDYDTDKDGVVDFFMGVFAGCGGNGASQLSVAGCEYTDAPYDNIWPHSSSLEGSYSEERTGLPGVPTNDQLKDLEGRPLWYTNTSYTTYTTTDMGDALKVFVRVGPYNLNPETAIDFASVISHEYGHSLGLPDFYSTGSRTTYGSWTLMAEDRSQNIDAFGRQELGWVVPQVLPQTGTKTVTGWKNSKQDTNSITWQRPDGTPYTLTEDSPGDSRVQNSEMYVAKLPGRQLLDAAAFDTGATATKSHLWWSGSGNDFACTPTAGRNFDLSVPELATLTDPNATVTLSFKSRWDIEWDFDYGYVLTTTDGGKNYLSHPSTEGYTTSNTDPTEANPNNVGCQATYDNGLTGSSGSYDAGTEAVDRKAGNVPDPVFLADSYDVSDLAGAANGAIRFSYATDPGLARPGWFVDDVKVTVDPDGAGGEVPHDAFVTDFEGSGGPTDSHVFNGGCRDNLSTAQGCTVGWKYLQAGAASEQDHAYYLEMRDRSGFDFNGRGEADRGEATFQSGLYLSYTDEAHGYGNVGTDDPPAQSPLDAVPDPGNDTPELDDAAFTAAAARSTYTDSGAGHTDNYTDPSTTSGNWEFKYNCLGFHVDSMSGEDAALASNLTGDVTFNLGTGCGAFNYGYSEASGASGNTAPVAKAAASPPAAVTGQTVTFSGVGSTDAESPNNLTYSWDFGDGGTSKDAAGRTVTHAFAKAGTYTAKLSVSDPDGATGSATTTVVVSPRGSAAPKAHIKVKPHRPKVDRKFKLVGKKSTGTGTLTYSWNFHNGGKKVDATGKRVKAKFGRAGRHKVSLTVTDSTGQHDKLTKRFRVRGGPIRSDQQRTGYFGRLVTLW